MLRTRPLVNSPPEGSCGDQRGWKHSASRAPYSGREAVVVVVAVVVSAGRSWKPCCGQGGLREYVMTIV